MPQWRTVNRRGEKALEGEGKGSWQAGTGGAPGVTNLDTEPETTACRPHISPLLLALLSPHTTISVKVLKLLVSAPSAKSQEWRGDLSPRGSDGWGGGGGGGGSGRDGGCAQQSSREMGERELECPLVLDWADGISSRGVVTPPILTSPSPVGGRTFLFLAGVPNGGV